MKIESCEEDKQFKPFKIVIESKEEAMNLWYTLPTCICLSDPDGVKCMTRHLLDMELRRQGFDIVKESKIIEKRFEELRACLNLGTLQ